MFCLLLFGVNGVKLSVASTRQSPLVRTVRSHSVVAYYSTAVGCIYLKDLSNL